MIKVLFSDNSLRELMNFRGDVIRDYVENGNMAVLVAPVNRNYAISNGIKIIPVDISRSGMNPIVDIMYFMKLLKIYRTEKPDYIFHYTIKPNIYGSVAAAMLGIPSTAMIAGLGYVFTGNGPGSRLARLMYRFAMRFPEKIFVLNEYNRDLIIQKKIALHEKIVLLKGGEGVDLKKFNTDV